MKALKKKVIALGLVLALLFSFDSQYVFADNTEIRESKVDEESEIKENQVDEECDNSDLLIEEIENEQNIESETEQNNIEDIQQNRDELVMQDSDSVSNQMEDKINDEIVVSEESLNSDESFEAETPEIMEYRKVTFDKNFNSSVLPKKPGNGKNKWQVIRGEYIGPYDKTDVSQGFDAKANVSYSADDSVRMTKNVINTDIENEFLMYLNVEPQVSWQDVLKLNTIKVSNNKRPLKPPAWPSGGHTSQQLVPEPTGSHTVPVEFEYYAMVNGKKVIVAKTTMYAATKKVPNGGIGIGNPLLAPEGESFYAKEGFDLKDKGQGVSVAEIDISTIYNKYEFAMQKVHPKSVQDMIGKHIKIDESSFNYDGGNYKYSNGIINWTLPSKDLGLLPYEKDENGNVVPSGIRRKLENGKYTYYRQEAYQMTYAFSLLVQDQDFVSAKSADSLKDINQDYAVQTNKSPSDLTNKEKGGELTYVIENEGEKKADFKSPYIKGLLYNLEFQKVVEGSKIPLKGVTFKINRKTGKGSSYSEQITYSFEDKTDQQGWIKFHDLPWGTYTVTEVSYNKEDLFQNQYMEENLPKEIGEFEVGEVINATGLTEDHGTTHSVDREKDLRNRLFLLSNGTVENKPYRAKIQIKKIVNHYEKISAELKKQNYTIKTESKDVYLKPVANQTELDLLNKSEQIQHQQVQDYDVIVPKNGGIVTLKELIPNEISDKVEFEKIEIESNAGSTQQGTYTPDDQGGSIKILPGNDITITVINNPVGTIQIKKEIENYRKELANDKFIIRADSVRGTNVDTEVVLGHNETSPTIKIMETTEIDIEEVLPKEYTFAGLTLTGGGTLNGKRVTVNPGENIVVTLHNKYEWKPYFHSSDAIMNIFKGNQERSRNE